MKSTQLNITALAIILIIAALSGCATVKPGYHSMQWKPLGKGLQTEKIYKDGIVWLWPWNGLVNYNLQWQTYSEDIAILTMDELHINISVSVTLRPIADEIAQLELEVGSSYYQSIIQPEFISLTRFVFSGYNYAIVSPKSPEIESFVHEKLVEYVKGKHLEIDNVTINHIVYPKVVTAAVDRKLAVEQDIQQKDYEIEIAEKQAEIQRILARGQRDAQKIIAEGLTKLYLQYKALEVQDKLTTSPNTKFYFVPTGKDGLPIIVDTNQE